MIQQVVATGGHLIRPWFTQLEPISLEHGLLEIEVPGKAEQQYCQQHATRLFTEAAQAATGRLIGVCFLTAAQKESQGEHPTQVEVALPEPPVALNDDYAFETFVTGPCNRLAHAASVAVSESPGRTYNPLFLHGSVGLGKTHLLQATCRKIAQDNPRASLSILSCETFVNHFIEAVEKGQLHEFRYRYRHADVLAIDDIQFLSDHEQTQEEFFHTFNTLYQAQKQIILSSDRSPSEIPHLEERLVSRFNWGLVARIDRPCYETRIAILHKKARLRSVELPEDVVCFIASLVDSNTRELEGAISKVAMLAKVADRSIDLRLAEEALGAEPVRTTKDVTIESILAAVTTRFNVRLADLQSKKRSRSIALPRQVCMFLARTLTRHSLEEIGGYFGGRDHSTVLHANKTIDRLRQRDPQLQAAIDRITQEIQAAT
ncbi:MAG TPA: chromosomal replication initiator protein DnaA [Phycisphaerae bacterium]|nr:chromosomal replication initiator protein DnaA [Phycisphaerae bacterium]HQL75349.1 chromosomal replication initiator protein DnaA [Phycisphaerae bacterium]